MWKTEIPKAQPVVRTEARHGYVNLSLSPATNGDGTTWQYLSMSFGEFSEDDVESCQGTWPRTAIDLARKQLDEFEQFLNERGTDETSIR